MAKWKLCFVLLLPLTVFFKEEVSCRVVGETLLKTIGSESDVTPICTYGTFTIITLVVCKISTERSREGCSLLYQYGHDFESECDSRFKLMMDNHTAFLHLMDLTPEDSGIYTCECSHLDETFILHLNVTVEEKKDASGPTHELIQFALIVVTVAIIITGVSLKLIHRRKRHGDQQSATSGSSVCKTLKCLDPDDPDDPYISLQHTTSDIYQSVSTETAQIHHQEISRKESDPSYTMYENI